MSKIYNWEEIIRDPSIQTGTLVYHDEWIKVSDRMPDKDGRYLVVEAYTPRWVGISSLREGKFESPVIYWQLIPDAPEE